MNELESIVRASLEQRVQSPPRMTETADRAICGNLVLHRMARSRQATSNATSPGLAR